MFKLESTISWFNIAGILFVMVVAASAAVLAPVLAHQLRVTNGERSQAAIASVALDQAGIAKCPSDYPLDLREFIDRRVNGDSRLSLTVAPAWGNPWGIQLIGDEVFLVQVGPNFWPPPPPPMPGEPAIDYPPVTAQVHRAPLTPETAGALTQLFTDRTSRASGDRVHGYDGVAYSFVAGPHCAVSWSPEPETGAGRLVQLVDLLAEHAQLTNEKDRAASERRIALLVKAFRRSSRKLEMVETGFGGGD